MEIASRSTAAYDQGGKLRLYESLGALEYWLYDSTGGEFYDEPLAGNRLVNGEYVRMEMRYENDGSVWAHSDVLNLDLWWIDGELRFWDPVDRRWLLDLEESEEMVVAQAARADSESRAGRLGIRAGRLGIRAGRLGIRAGGLGLRNGQRRNWRVGWKPKRAPRGWKRNCADFSAKMMKKNRAPAVGGGRTRGFFGDRNPNPEPSRPMRRPAPRPASRRITALT